jgi:hypothetical protein
MEITLNDINKQIKSSKKISINLNINSNFEQENKIPKRLGDYIKKEETKEQINKLYKEGDIIEIPEILTNIYNLDNYYLYGVSHDNDLIESILFNIDENYKFENNIEKNNIIKELKDLLKNDIDSKLQSDGKFFKIKKEEIVKMIDTNNFTNTYIKLLGMYFNINILIVNLDDNNYYIAEELTSNKSCIIIVKYNTKFVPILHMFNNSSNYSICSTFLKHFKNSD